MKPEEALEKLKAVTGELEAAGYGLATRHIIRLEPLPPKNDPVKEEKPKDTPKGSK
jgi:hypothetical protein